MRVWLGWSASEQRSYAAVERVDNVYANTYEDGNPALMWLHDDAGSMVDGDHSGGDYNGFGVDVYGSGEYTKLLTERQAQQYVLIPESPDSVLIGSNTSASGWVTGPPWADAGGRAVGRDPTTSVIELAVTGWDSLVWRGPELSRRSHLVEGSVIGFQFSVTDWDYTAPELRDRYHGFHTLSGLANTWRMADNFVDGYLAGPAWVPADPLAWVVTDFAPRDQTGDGVLDAGEELYAVFIAVPAQKPYPAGITTRLEITSPPLVLLPEDGTSLGGRCLASEPWRGRRSRATRGRQSC
ncbi:MAG: hypothetical protein AB1505_25580 [Candidatus Latescibacterota bacterium]